MSFRRLLVAGPLALLVAMAAHAAGFGSSHLLGGSAGADLAGVGLAWLALLAIVGIMAVALGAPFRAGSHAASRAPAGSASRALAESLPGGGNPAMLAATLALGGSAFYVALEVLEGHAPQGSLLALVTILPLAVGVALAARLGLAWIARAGVSLAAFAHTEFRAENLWMGPALVPARTARATPAHAHRRGRAPPSRA
jgi:hypothetical protein